MSYEPLKAHEALQAFLQKKKVFMDVGEGWQPITQVFIDTHKDVWTNQNAIYATFVPTVKEWTLETCPDFFMVKEKSSKDEIYYAPLSVTEKGIVIFNNKHVNWDMLFRDYIQKNGDPCGSIEEDMPDDSEPEAPSEDDVKSLFEELIDPAKLLTMSEKAVDVLSNIQPTQVEASLNLLRTMLGAVKKK